MTRPGTFEMMAAVPSWAVMWVLAGAIFLLLKAATWASAGAGRVASAGEAAAYFILWPGLAAREFLDRGRPQNIPVRAWVWAVVKLLTGAGLIWMLAPAVPHALAAGWIGMIGMVLLLHFGLFEVLALYWRSRGVRIRPLMRDPLAARSLAEFWGDRWNRAFRDVAHEFIVRPVAARCGSACALWTVFLISGAVHELVISVPAGGGWGGPTIYFLIQGAGFAFERSRAGLRWRGRKFTLLVAGLPLFWLFHPPFVFGVINPFLRAIGALR
jgi:Membrane bound O-acyl transferase family